MAASPRSAKLGGAHGFYCAPRSGQALTCVGRWRPSARVRALITLSAAMGCLVGAAPAAGSVVISIQGDAIVVRGTEATSFAGTDGGTGGEVRFEPVSPGSEPLYPPQAEPIEAGPGCASRTEPYPWSRLPDVFLDPSGMPIPGAPLFLLQSRTFVSCPTAGITRVDADLGDGPNTLVPHRSAGQQALQPPLPLLYRGGSGVDQVSGFGSGSVVDGGGGNDKLFGAGGRYAGGPGNDAIRVSDLARDGAGELTVADGGDGDDTLSGETESPVTPDNPDGDPVFEGHLIGGPGNDQVTGRLAEGGEGDDAVAGHFVDAGPGNDSVSALWPGAKVLRCGPGVDRWGFMRWVTSNLVHSDCPPFLTTGRQFLAMRFDRRNRLLVPFRFTQAVQLSATLVNFRGNHAFLHHLRVRVPERGRVFRLRITPKALEAMRARGRRAYVGIWFTARDAEGELMRVSRDDRYDGWALRPRRR